MYKRQEQRKKKEFEKQEFERERKLRQSNEKPKKRSKDYSKLCNRYVWSGECRGEKSWCRYTHKTLCRQLRKEGECTNDECRDGHNIDGICKEYNKGSCRYGSERCRFLHIKIQKQVESKKQRTTAVDKNEKERKGVHSKEEDFLTDDEDLLERAERKDVDRLAKRNDVKMRRVRFENSKQETEDSGREKSKGSRDRNKKSSDRYQEGQGGEGRMPIVDRGLKDFLRLGWKRDIWKDIKATEKEVKILEKELKKSERRKTGHQNQ